LERIKVTEQELVIIINSELKKHDECTYCHVNGILALRETGPDGCNWSEPYVTCSGTPAVICGEKAIEVITDVRKRYNLKN